MYLGAEPLKEAAGPLEVITQQEQPQQDDRYAWSRHAWKSENCPYYDKGEPRDDPERLFQGRAAVMEKYMNSWGALEGPNMGQHCKREAALQLTCRGFRLTAF